MRFLIMGTGGIGGFFGGKLFRAGAEVWFIARGKHLAAMQSDGLKLNTSEGDYTVPPGRMATNPSDAPPPDVVLFCTKSYDTESAATLLSPILTRETIVITLQNGIDNAEKIQRLIRAGTVYGGVAYVYSTVTAPGVITEGGGPKKIVFGPMDHNVTERDRSILATFRQAGIDADLSSNILSDLWKKFVFITGASGITALTRLTTGELLAHEGTKGLIRDAMLETQSVGSRLGVEFAPDLIDGFFTTLGRFTNNTRSSLYYDLVNERPLEIESLAGTVVSLGKKLGIPTPIQRVVYATLLPYHLRHLRKRDQLSTTAPRS